MRILVTVVLLSAVCGCSDLVEGAPDSRTTDSGTTASDMGTPVADTGTPGVDVGTPPRDTGSPDVGVSCLAQGASCAGGASSCCTPFSCSPRDGAGTVCCGNAGTSCTSERGCCGSLECRGGACAQPAPRCGDGNCASSESCTSCPSDCGACPPSCGDGTCNGSESCSSCPADCGGCAPTCTRREAESCTPNSTTACCADGRTCGTQPLMGSRCCRGVGGACAQPYGCCGRSECVGGTCRCDPQVATGNGCPGTAPYCGYDPNSGVTACATHIGGAAPGGACTGSTECPIGYACLSSVCTKFCTSQDRNCPAGRSCVFFAGNVYYGLCR
jgi:hypothetical protein